MIRSAILSDDGRLVRFLTGRQGDFDEVGKLTVEDFAIMAANFGLKNAPPEGGDMDLAWDVDFQDVLTFSRVFRSL